MTNLASPICSLTLLILVTATPNDGIGQVASSIQLTDVTVESGVNFQHTDGSTGKKFLIEAIASGMGSFDYDSDGRIDLYFVNGSQIVPNEPVESKGNGMYRNVGAFQFADVSRQCGLDHKQFGLGVVVGDMNNDGFEDVYLSNYGPNALYLNNGDGTFHEVVDNKVLQRGNKVGGGVCMFDMEADGNLDLYVANYIRFDPSIPASVYRGRTTYGGPLLYGKEADNLIRNLGDGNFKDVSEESGVGRLAEWGMGTICVDYDQDGDTDVLVANDSTRNFLWENDGTGAFSEVALISGFAFDHRGDVQGSMGLDAADFDGDLLLDVYQTAYVKQFATLYKGNGIGFEDVTQQVGAGTNTFYQVEWGTAFVDFDNDADKDIFVAHGHIHDNLDDLDDTVSFKLPNQILENLSGKKFADVSSMAGTGLKVCESSRGAVADDLDNDGKIDVAVLNIRTAPTIMRNSSTNTNHWIELELVGVQSNRSAAGTKVKVTAGGKTQILEVHCGRGYQSHFGKRLHFGLGSSLRIDSIEVMWHVGNTELFRNIVADRVYWIGQNKGIQELELK
jgi:hypothetical protein